MTTSIKFSELKNLPPISPERMAEIDAFEDTDFSDCPEITDEEWRTAQPLYPQATKAEVRVKLDTDILRWLKTSGENYQARLNGALRFAMQKGF